MKYSYKPPRTSFLGLIWKRARLAFMCLSCALLSNFVHGQAVQLRDIRIQERMDLPMEYSELTSKNGRLFFIGLKRELWTSSGNDSTEDTRLLRRFKSISNLTSAGSLLYFIADDGVSGSELWRTDGSEAGTVKVKNIRPGARGSNIRFMTNVYGTLYFSANDGIHGQELWRSNGGPGNTIMVKDIHLAGSSSPTSLTDVNGMLFFSANNGVHGYELWKSDGKASGTVLVKDIRAGSGLGSSPGQLANMRGTLFFDALSSGIGRELWRSDGTSEGTWLIKDVRPGSLGSGIQNTTAVYKTLFFTATDGIHGHELWKSDGTNTGTVLVKDMTPGPDGSHGQGTNSFPMGNFANMYGTLYYTAFLGSTSYIWKSDGTTQGTIPIAESWGQDATSQPQPQFTWFNNTVFFIERAALEYNHPYTLTGGHLIEIYSYLPPYHPEMVRVNDHLYISGQPEYLSGSKIFKTTAHSDNEYDEIKVTIRDIQNWNKGSHPNAFVKHDELVYFNADDDHYTSENLWVTDGTPEGTGKVFEFPSEISETEVAGDYLYSAGTDFSEIYKTDLNTNTTDLLLNHEIGSPGSLTAVNNSLYFVAGISTLWKSNGTQAGTSPLQSFNSIKTMDALNSSLLFRVVQQDGSEELWTSRETSPTPIKLKTLHSGITREALSYPTAAVGNTHYFVANNGIHGNELWKSDGTATGTSMVIDLNTNESGTDPEDGIRTLVAFRDTLYFSAQGTDGAWAIYKTNGTATGTKRIRNVGPIAHAVAAEDQLFLFVYESVTDSTTQLWTTNGSFSGTRRIFDFHTASTNIHHTFVDGLLYFSIIEGGSLWRSDGTTCATTQVNTGVQGAYPMAAINSTLIFGAYTDESGQEPYALNTAQIPYAPCYDEMSAAIETASFVTAQQEISSYPNPFTGEFAFRINGNGHELACIKVVNLAGNPVEEMTEIALNTDYTIGKSWAPGVYLIHVQMKNAVRTHIVVKK